MKSAFLRMKFAFVSAAHGQVSLPFMTMPPTIEFASLGMWDSLILMLMALVVFGPRRLPEIGRQIGRLMYEARKLSNEFKFQMEEEFRKAEEAERQKTEVQRLAALAASAQAAERSGTVSFASEAGSEATPTGSIEAADPTTMVAASGLTAEEFYPRILPPSTGEPVAAARPGGLAASVDTAGTFEAVSQVSEARPGAPDGSDVAPGAAGEAPEEARVEPDKTAPASDEAHHG
jgi:sec-independent protein translocase protein TatB